MYLDAINSKTISFGDARGVIVSKLDVSLDPVTGMAKVKVEGSDTKFKAEFAADQITATGTAMDLRDGLRMELSEDYNKKYGIFRYRDGTIIPNVVDDFTLAADLTANPPTVTLSITVGAEVDYMDLVTHKPPTL